MIYLRGWYWDWAPFNIIISDTDSGIEWTLSTVLFGTVNIQEGRDAIYREFGRLEKWVCAHIPEVQQGQVQDPEPGLGQSEAHIQAGQRMNWEHPWGEGPWGIGCWKTQPQLAMCTCSPESQSSCPASKESWGTGWERWFCPSTLLSWDSTCSIVLSCGPCSIRRIWNYWSKIRGGPRGWSDGWSTSHERLRELGCSV